MYWYVTNIFLQVSQSIDLRVVGAILSSIHIFLLLSSALVGVIIIIISTTERCS